MATTTLTRVAHACVLLDFDGHTILTDPWLSEKAGYYQGEKRPSTPPPTCHDWPA